MEKVRIDYLIILLIALIVVMSGIRLRSEKMFHVSQDILTQNEIQ